MAEKKREIAGWITAFGNHIPIYTDDPNLSSYQEMWDKERQIEANKKEAQSRNIKQNEGPGEYTVYRSGDLSGGPTGMVFFAAGDEESAKLHAEHYSGRSGRKHIYHEYKLNIKNPLVVEGTSDSDVSLSVYNKLHNTNFKDTREFAVYMKSLGHKKVGVDATQLFIDSENAKALKNQKKYDAIIYKTRTNTVIKNGQEVWKGGRAEVSQILTTPDKIEGLKPVAEHKRRNRRGN